MRGGDSFTRALGRMRCKKCGGTNTREEVGKATDVDRFEGMIYRVCGGCGHVEPLPKRRKVQS